MALERKHERWLATAGFVLVLGGLEVFFGIDSRLAAAAILAAAFVIIVVSRHWRK